MTSPRRPFLSSTLNFLPSGWAFMSGDARVGFVEAMRALYGQLPDATAALRAAFAAHYDWLNRCAAQRARFRSYRASYLTPPPLPPGYF